MRDSSKNKMSTHDVRFSGKLAMRLLILFVAIDGLGTTAWGAGIESKTELSQDKIDWLHSGPSCDSKASVAEKLKTLDQYTELLGSALDLDPKKIDDLDWQNRAEIFAPVLLPKTAKFRNFAIQCWTGFEEARRNLELSLTGKGVAVEIQRAKAQRSLRYWESCLKEKPAEIQRIAEPAISCLRIQNDTKGNEN